MDFQKIKLDFFRPLITFTSDGNGDGSGNGYGYGDGNGDGNGDGYGYGDGSGNGDGDGNGDGYGDGNGNGHGYGNGYGNGNGHGYGYGHGYGHGYGNGNGHGYGDGIISFNNQKVYIIDKIQTIIKSIKNDIAKGFILNGDLSLDECYIVRNDYFYSHGKTLKEALKSLTDKTESNLPIELRIKQFQAKFNNYNLKQKASLLYDWHFKLTGSCKTGRDSFCLNHNIDLKKDKFTIYEFIELTKNSYGSEVIKQLLINK